MAAAMAALIGMGEAAESAERSSETVPALKKALQRFPQADGNNDGILTESEARAYQRQVAPELSARADALASRSANDGAKTDAIAPTMANVRYGPYERNVFDVWIAESAEPAPVVVFWHGGGFSKGDKGKFAASPELKSYLENGISAVAGNYRLIDATPFPGFMMDGARTIQFIRSKAAEWNIDPNRICLSGGSAGANMSLWLALHDDLANPQSADPVERISSRVSSVACSAAQTFNDPEMVLKYIGGSRERPHPSTFGFFGVQSLMELDLPEKRQMAYEASAINFVSPDDPPLFLLYGGDLTPTPLPESAEEGVRIHHPRFGEMLKEKYDALGLECHLYYKSKPAPPGARLAFVKKHFGMQ